MPRDARDSPTPAVLRDARARERTRAMVGNHPQLSAALTSVQALNAAYAAHQREKLRGGDDDIGPERKEAGVDPEVGRCYDGAVASLSAFGALM